MDRKRKPLRQRPTWQEQYDLGVKYLSEGNYQEAIIAFTAAIEIDPKRPDAYTGLADAYIAQGDIAAAIGILRQGGQMAPDAPSLIGQISWSGNCPANRISRRYCGKIRVSTMAVTVRKRKSGLFQI